MVYKYVILLFAIMVLFIGGCSSASSETGRLQGSVTIGPVFPVERPGETVPIPCEVYEARKIDYTTAPPRVHRRWEADFRCQRYGLGGPARRGSYPPS